ncbi:DUF6384 family protein [Phreatobacter stygius]|uniref:Uncharacterized protein n=1 Tax=Phreatobacter stygius TaxID=1940610 RepID=A0A4D7BAQ2_9HYPH|nr:DUF6384 family protein [Phreatobacter stygius]QCI65192.1 hypothetical protein E8M01_13820 [Phreatobacter stygius]
MTDTAVAAAPVAAAQPPAQLDDVMLAMDVVDTLRHRAKLTERELAEGDREEDLIERLREIYRNQGITVSDEILKQGVKALREERFVYKPPASTLRVKLARLYVRRGVWGKWALGALAALGIGTGTLVYQDQAARTELSTTIPASLTQIAGDINRDATVDAIKARVAALVADGQSAARDGKAELARKTVAELAQLRDEVRSEYDVRVVSRPGELTGIIRAPNRNRAANNYYLVVEAIGRDGRPLSRSVTSEEDGAASVVSKWAVRVPESVFDEIRRDKADDGIIQNATLGRKARGQLEPTWRVALPGGAITRW